MKKVLLTALVLLPLTVSCGKNEIVQSVMKESIDGIKVVAKGTFDVLDTGAKAINDTHNESKRFLTNAKRVTDKGLTDSKNYVDESLTENKRNFDENAHKLIKHVGKEIEFIGQFPRELANDLLGTDPDSNEDLADLEDRVDVLEAEMHNSFYDLSEEIQSLAVELRQADSNLASSINDAIQKAENELAVEINRTTRNSRRIRRALNRIRGVKRDVRRISRDLYNLEIVCENITGFVFIDVTPVCEVI